MSLLWAIIRIMIKRENKGVNPMGKIFGSRSKKDNISNKEELHEKQRMSFKRLLFTFMVMVCLCVPSSIVCTNR